MAQERKSRLTRKNKTSLYEDILRSKGVKIIHRKGKEKVENVP
ncbi:MAG: hypothetical protein ACFFCZ_19400 [Promethearchaeota archaeon]